MFIETTEAQKIRHGLQEELANGNHWVVYNTMQSYHKATDFFAFENKDEAFGFARNNLSDRDDFVALPLKYVFDQLDQALNSEKLSKQNRSIPVNLDLDISFKKENQYTFKSTTMNQKNFDYLKDQVKFTGFGEGLENDLKEKIQKQTPEFTLYHNSKFGNDITASALHFKKSDQSDMYFFNSYQVSLKKENTSDIMQQTFYINKGNNITLKEAYNLMSGRAVNKDLSNKEGQLYNAWVQMDFKQTENNGNYKMKQFHQNYGFDLEKELSKHPIKELNNDQDKSRLMDSLHKGNRQSVTFIQNGNEQKHFIEANPQFKTINVYESNMRRLDSKHSKEEKQSEGESAAKHDAKKEKQTAGSDDDGPEMPKGSKKRTRKQSPSMS